MSHITTTRVVTREVASSNGSGVHVMTGNRNWYSNLCGCVEDCANCVGVSFCAPCCAGILSERVGEHCCVPCLVPGGLIALRTKIRLMLGIRGSICNDCVMATFCGPCILCQMKRELDAVNWPK